MNHDGAVNIPVVRRGGGEGGRYSESRRRILGELGEFEPRNAPMVRGFPRARGDNRLARRLERLALHQFPPRKISHAKKSVSPRPRVDRPDSQSSSLPLPAGGPLGGSFICPQSIR
jgi:hypothetical protein